MIDIMAKIDEVIKIVTNFAAMVEKLKSGYEKHELLAIREEVIKLNESSMALKEQAFALREDIKELEKEYLNAKNVAHKLDDLVHREITGGAHAYVIKDFTGDIKKTEWYCQACLDNRKHISTYKRIKQDFRSYIYKCHECGSEIHFPHNIPQTANVGIIPSKFSDF